MDYVTHNDTDIISYVDKLFNDACFQKASDIHIEPFSNHCQIRIRTYGALKIFDSTTNVFATRIITRLKIMAQLNIAEKRLPQDGRILVKKPNHLDIRLSTCPTLYGEKVVMRLLNVSQYPLDLYSLGMSQTQLQSMLHALSQSHGLILIAGATGSGKTTTLYSAINHLNNSKCNIITIEDPVEIELNGVIQVNVNPRIGLTFPNLLRTILRQDPDIIMIGEIRDAETALIAMQAAQTGHLVLSTIHANNPNGVITRLQAMDITPDYIKHALSLIVSQRLHNNEDGKRMAYFEVVTC